MKSQFDVDLENRKAEYKDFKRWQKIVAAQKGWFDGDSRLNASFINSAWANQSTVIASITINMHVVKVPYRMGYVADGGWSKDSVHYQVKIWVNGDEKRGFVFSYSQGSGVKQFPTIAEILYSFINDALYGAESFDNFCGNTGSDNDSIKARRVYETCNEVFGWFQSNRVYESQLVKIGGILQEADNMGDLNSEVEFMEMPTADEDNVPF